MKNLVVAGIGTEIGKTIVSAILCQKMKADYWKPVQAGGLNFTDSDLVDSLTSSSVQIHQEKYRLTEPMSPHAAAKIDDVEITLSSFQIPETANGLIIELAGGLMVPLNSSDTNLDLIKKLNCPVVVVSRYYLGNINHTLLTCQLLRQSEINVAGIIFNGEKNQESKDVILSMTKLPNLGDIPVLEEITKESIERMTENIIDFE